MGRIVQLTITGRQQDESGDINETKTTAPAEYYEKSGTHYIFYEETPEDASTAGKTTVATKCIIKCKDSVLELMKKGQITTRMVFAPGAEYLTDYLTPFGCLKLGINTHSVECSQGSGLPQIRAAYALTSEGRLLSECTIDIDMNEI